MLAGAMHRTLPAPRHPGIGRTTESTAIVTKPPKTSAPSLLSDLWAFFSEIVDDVLRPEAAPAKRPAKGGSRRPTRVAPRPRSRYPLVPQDDDTGCGIACVAMLAGVSYEQAKAATFPPSPRKRKFYTGGADLRRGLKAFGLTLEPTARAQKFTAWSQLETTSIVAIEQVPRHKSRWHWVVFVDDGVRRYVLDPSWPEAVRTDFKRMQGRSFLRVVALAGQNSGPKPTRARSSTKLSPTEPS